MKRFLLACAFGLSFATPALAQDDPCSGVDLAANEVGLNYQGHCVAADDSGPPVQSIIVQRTEDLDGAKSVFGIVLVRTIDGWKVEPDEFYTDKDIDAAEVGDGGHLVIDEGD